MPSVSLSFKVHIPYRLRKTEPVRTGHGNYYFDIPANKDIADKFSDECYLTANKLLFSLIKKCEGKFRVSFSISGTAIEILQKYRPDVIHSFKELAKTGCVDFFGETYYNSLSWMHSKKEFQRQVLKHHELIRYVFEAEPQIFRNTELIYDNELAMFIGGLGYRGILCEGLDRILNGRSPNQTYATPGNGDFGVLLRNVRLSDDVAFRFDDPSWNEQPLTAEKYADWLHSQSEDNCNVNLFFDYETFGIHKKANTGIFEFLRHLPPAVLANENWVFTTPAEALENYYPKDIYDVPKTISWRDNDVASCIWSENVMQNNTLRKIYSLENIVNNSKLPGAREWWGSLQSADHFYYMCNDGRTADDTYRLMNPFTSGEEAFKNYENAVTDFEIKLIQKELNEIRNKKAVNSVSHIFSTMIY